MTKHGAIIGMQFGDEGKGKIIDYVQELVMNELIDKASRLLTFGTKKGMEMGQALADKIQLEERIILMNRYQGGGNAGHTVKHGDKTYALFQTPSGILSPHTFNLFGKQAFLNPRTASKEYQALVERGITVSPDNFGISANTHMTFDFHTNDDMASYNLAEHTSTGSGIKQTAVDKDARLGMRFIEFLDKDLMFEVLKEKRFAGDNTHATRRKLHYVLAKNAEEKGESFNLSEISHVPTLLKAFVESYDGEREYLSQFLVNETAIFASPQFEYWLSEGAQAFGLDVDEGLYPGTTSSKPASPPHRPDWILGIFKAYMSSVGIGDRAFVTKMETEAGNHYRELWDEFGTKTGRPRHVGHFDALYGKHAVETTHMDIAALTCLDKLEHVGEMGETLKIATAYKVNGKVYDNFDISFFKRNVLQNAVPVYEEMPSWTKTVNDNGELNPEPRAYVERVEELLDTKVGIVGIGPEHSEIIVRHNPLKLQ